MTYPNNRLALAWGLGSGAQIVYLLDTARKNDMVGAIMLCFPGRDPTYGYLPRGRHGPFNMSVYYRVPGFVVDENGRVPDKEWDRIVYSDGTVRICFQSYWALPAHNLRSLVRVELYFDAGVGLGYEYMGATHWEHIDNLLAKAHWDPDPNPSVGKQPVPE